MEIESSKIPRMRPGIKILERGEGFAYLVHPDGTVKIVNTTALEILRLCDGTRSLSDIARIISEKYGVDYNLALSEITNFIKKAIELNVVEIYENK